MPRDRLLGYYDDGASLRTPRQLRDRDAIELWAEHVAEIEKRNREIARERRGMPELGIEESPREDLRYWYLLGV